VPGDENRGTEGTGARTALITGAGSGIGRALALRLAAPGVRLALWDRDADALAQAARRCEDAGARVRAGVIDVRDPTAVVRLAGDATDDLGPPRLLLCIAGVTHTGDVLASGLDDLRAVVDVNLWGVVHTVRAVLPLMIAGGGGRVVTVSSAFGLMAAPGYSAYCASKFAVRGFTESLRQEMVARGRPVRVHCVCPGGVRTPIVRHGTFAAGVDAESAADRFEHRIARLAPEQAAEAILRGLRRDRARVLVGADARLAAVTVRALGSSYQRLLPALLRWVGGPPTASAPGHRQGRPEGRQEATYRTSGPTSGITRGGTRRPRCQFHDRST
jgi:short-subunit dehydrogenase